MLAKPHQMLIVEDQPLISMMMEEMAADLGWDTLSACTSDGALKELARSHPVLAILDIQLTTTDSLSVAEQCRALHIPIVFATGLSASDIPEECGDAPILTKPLLEDDFASAVQQAIVQNLRHA
jgi:CheY-like chemotaxis protein